MSDQFEFSMCDNDDEWDDFLINCSLGHHEQSSLYAATRVERGYKCDRVVVRRNGRIVGGVQILVQPTPVGNFARIFRGPVVVNDDPQLMRMVVSHIERIAKNRSYASVRVDLFPNQSVAFAALKEAGYIPTISWYREKNSVAVPLNLTDAELASGMNKIVAYNVRRATRKGVIVKPGDETSIDAFYDLHRETAAYQGFPVFSREHFFNVWSLFGLLGKAQHFIAYYEDKPYAAIFNTIVGDQMYYGWGGMRRDSEAKKMRVNFLLHMTAIAWAREHGCTQYDFVGDQPFKKWFAIKTIQWPRPLQKFYGHIPALRWRIFNVTGENPKLKHLIVRLSRLYGLPAKKDMPW